MFLASVIVGGLTGCVGLIVEATSTFFEENDMAGSPKTVAFLYALHIMDSYVLSASLFSHLLFW